MDAEISLSKVKDSLENGRKSLGIIMSMRYLDQNIQKFGPPQVMLDLFDWFVDMVQNIFNQKNMEGDIHLMYAFDGCPKINLYFKAIPLTLHLECKYDMGSPYFSMFIQYVNNEGYQYIFDYGYDFHEITERSKKMFEEENMLNNNALELWN